jgi:hypothetical protein
LFPDPDFLRDLRDDFLHDSTTAGAVPAQPENEVGECATGLAPTLGAQGLPHAGKYKQRNRQGFQPLLF